MSKFRIDLAPVMPYIITTSVIGGVVGGLGLLFYELYQGDAVKYDVIAATQKIEDNTTHTLVNAHTISRQEGPLYTTFNFGSRHVYIAGNVNGAAINGAFTFRTFENDAMIEDVRKAGCETARQAAGLLENYNYGSLFTTSSDHVTVKQGEARNFIKQYCAPAP